DGFLPTGTVTFLFTDIVGSTQLLRQDREGYAAALALIGACCEQRSQHTTVGRSTPRAIPSSWPSRPPAKRWPPQPRRNGPWPAIRGPSGCAYGCGWSCTPARPPSLPAITSAWPCTTRPASPRPPP